MSKYQKLEESFIDENDKVVDWENIVVHQNLSEEYMRYHKNQIGFNNILTYQGCTESFIEELLDINSESSSSSDSSGDNFNDEAWSIISKYQVLSERFISESWYHNA